MFNWLEPKSTYPTMESDKNCIQGSSLKSVTSEEDMFAEAPEDSSDDTRLDAPSSSTEEKSWRGTPLSEMPQINSHSQFPPVVPSASHSVLYKLPFKEGELPGPWPREPFDSWDQNHVRMPQSPSSLYPVTETELRRRWQLVQSALSSPITSCHQLEAAILHYNSKYSDRWDFTGLRTFFDETLEEVETEYFFSRVLPKVVKLALNLPEQLTGSLPLLRQHATRSISLTQKQVSCLLANALLCTFPRRNTSKKNSEYGSFPDINFNRLFIGEGEGSGRRSALQEKLKCLINYFRRVTTKVPEGVVTYSRNYVPPEKLPDWSTESCQLPPLHITSDGTIEDHGTGFLQMDFANKFVGGGVLGRGCVQEEIRFVICPELILARLFTEVLDDTEALIVTGCERFSQYRGYADSFEWDGNVEDKTPRDKFGRRICTVVAIDAFRFQNAKTQYSPAKINRELNKAYAGFSWGGGSEAVATGNWGCGAFGGDACLKALLQLMAAAKAGRPVAYFTFGNSELRDQVAEMHRFLTEKNVTVGRLWKVITSFNPLLRNQSLYDHITKCILNKSIPVPLTSFYNPSLKKHRVENERSTPDNCKKSEGILSNGKRLNPDQIDKVLDEVDESEGGVKPLEAKTLSIQRDKDLCLKRLSSSWSNLNESKKDFRPIESTSTPECLKDSANGQALDKSEMVSLVTQNLEPNKKKKISDYFHTVSKHKS